MRFARRTGSAALAAALALPMCAALAPPARAAAALELQRPRYTREQMEAALGEREPFLFVYGTTDSALAPTLRDRALAIARRLFGGDTTLVLADRDVDAARLAGSSAILVGAPRENAWTRRLAPAMPVKFTDRSFVWADRTYDRPGDALHLVWPHPLAPKRFVLLVAANSAAGYARRGGGFWFGSEDWRIFRDGELVRSGVFAQSAQTPWSYDPALDRDRERERERFAAALVATERGGARVLARRSDPDAPRVAAAAAALLARLDREGLSGPAVTLTLYASLEEKGALTRDTRPEHVDESGAAHAARPAGRAELDLESVAAARLRRLGAAADAPFLRPAAVALTDRFEGEPLARAVNRLYFGRLLPTAADAATRARSWRSPLVYVPARAVLVRSLLDCAGARRTAALRAALGAGAPGTLDSLCRRLGLDPARVASRYAALAESLARAGTRDAGPAPRAWRPADGFMRGVALAHSVSLERGYLSAACGREIATLAGFGANWISISPFGYVPSPDRPEILPSADGGPDEETDESLCEAGAFARRSGVRVMLKPHLWTRGWVGDLDYGPDGWPAFFDRYRVFILHYALLADREGFDGLSVGHELVRASLAQPEAWRRLIGEVRRVYRGTLTYDANWGEEVRGVRFWDALDLVSVSFYEPLSAKPTRSAAELKSGAVKALRGLKKIGEANHRPVLLGEIGYAPVANAPVRPWEEGTGPADPETQRACYTAAIDALEPELWVCGAFWWKWFTSGAPGGARDASFSPRGKPAEAEFRRSLADWRDRPVAVPRP